MADEVVFEEITTIDKLNRLGPALRLLRKGAYLTLGELARGLGMDVVRLSQLERGVLEHESTREDMISAEIRAFTDERNLKVKRRKVIEAAVGRKVVGPLPGHDGEVYRIVPDDGDGA